MESKTLDEILNALVNYVGGNRTAKQFTIKDAKQAIIEVIERAKPDLTESKDQGSMHGTRMQAFYAGYNDAVENFSDNLLRELGVSKPAKPTKKRDVDSEDS